MRLEAGGVLEGRLRLGAEDGIGSLGFASCDGSRVFKARVVQWILAEKNN